jgi:hypothetical protein
VAHVAHRVLAVHSRAAARAAAAVVMVLALGAGLGIGSAPAGAVSVPRISVQPSSIAPGTTVSVGGYDLDPLTNYQLQVCGNGGLGTSASCDQATTTTVATSEIGHFLVEMIVETPPAPCPCVVEALPVPGSGGVSQQLVSTPVDILGAPVATPVATPSTVAPSGLVVERATLEGSGSWAEWFGGPPHRTLVVRLRDAGQNLIPSTPFVMRSGKGPDPTQVMAAPAVPPLFPGQVISYRVPVSFPVLAFGHYEVGGVLGGPGQTIVFTATTRCVPWGVVVVAVVLVLVIMARVVLWIVRRRLRRRRASQEAGKEGEEGEAAPGAPASDQAITGPTDPPSPVAVSSGTPE